MPPPKRVLFIRPDAYGDLFLFEPIPRLVRHTWPDAEIAVLIRAPYADAIPLLSWDGMRILTTDCDPYRDLPEAHPAALESLRAMVQEFAPDCLVAACSGQTWLEPAVASFVPNARQVSLGTGLTDPSLRASLDRQLAVDWGAIYSESVTVEPDLPEWERNLRLATRLLGQEAPRWWPVARVPGAAADDARRILAALGLGAQEFVACAPTGIANVQIKAWPAAYYAESLAWLERERGVRALLFGHVAEREQLQAVCAGARELGASPMVWLGRDGELPLMAGLLSAARFYFGNDTGAMHLSAGLGRPVAAIFGGGNGLRFAPVGRRTLSIVQPLPCFGCRWDCFFVDAPCVRTISPASVRQALEGFLSNDADRQEIFEATGLHAEARAVIDTATPKLKFLRADSTDRLRQVNELTAQLTLSESDRGARLAQVNELNARLVVSDADRAARLQEVEQLNERLRVSESDRTRRLEEIAKLSERLEATEVDRTNRLAKIEELGALLSASDADRTARLEQVEQLGRALQASDEDRRARLVQIEALGAQLSVSDSDRTARLAMVTELAARLQASEEDRAARLVQIESLQAGLEAAEAVQAAQRIELETLRTPHESSESGPGDSHGGNSEPPPQTAVVSPYNGLPRIGTELLEDSAPEENVSSEGCDECLATSADS